MTTVVAKTLATTPSRLGGAHNPTSNVEFTEAPAAPLETRRSAHTEPRQGRHPEPESPCCDGHSNANRIRGGNPGGTEAHSTTDAVNGVPSLVVLAPSKPDPDTCLNERVDRACTQILEAVKYLNANRGTGGVSQSTAIRCRERLQLALAGFHSAGLLANPMRGI